ncbi:hypothetical protein B0H16DRAFT_809705 [Mycena metata]|uniref:Uncharacterized protein n=1 Tax=Mycena metata TaxID=1033252 RepID=A0AAD7NX06_9AGAR|nr:hypothetical protein B0H16DRAFT_809705 [Mycena metata]
MTSDPYWPPPTLNVEAEADTEDSAQPFLTPWEHLTDPKALPDADLPQDPEPSPLESMPSNGGYCGAAGCPHSCNCMPFLLFSPASRAAAAASMGARLSTSDGRSMSDVFGAPGGPSSLSLSLTQHRDRSRSRSHSRPRSRSLSRAPSPVNPIILHPPSASPLPSMSASIPVPNPELRGLLEDPPSLQNPPMSSSLPNMAPSRFLSPFPSSPLSREFRDPLSSKDRSAPLASSSKPRETQLHPPMLSHSRNPSPYPSTAPLADPAASQRPLLYRTPSGSSSRAVDEAQRSDRERRRAERSSTSRSSPLLMAEAAPVPMLRPQSHGLSIPASSSTHTSPAPPMARPHGTQPSSLRLPSPLLIPPAEGMSRTHASLTPLPSPSIPVPSKAHHAQPPAYPTPLPRPQAYTTPHPPMAIPNQPTVHQPSAPPMPRPQAHALPPSATTASSSRPSTKPTSSALQPTPAAYEYPNSAAAPTTRSAPDGPGPRSERVRRSDATDAPRGGYGGVTRGTSKHIPTAPTMTTPPSLLFT